MFQVVVAFADMQDGGYIYNVGDEFPRVGVSVSKERLEELSSNRNRRGIAMIVDENPKEGLSEAEGDTEEAEAGVSPSEASEAEKKPRKGQKKNVRTDSELYP